MTAVAENRGRKRTSRQPGEPRPPRPLPLLPYVGEGDGQYYGDDWVRRAKCASGDPDALFVQGAEQNKAKRICLGCQVSAICAAEALDTQDEWGVRGGLTERQRRDLLRRRRNVVNAFIAAVVSRRRHG